MNRRTFIRAAGATLAVGAINKLAGTPTVAAEPTPTSKVSQQFDVHTRTAESALRGIDRFATPEARDYVYAHGGPRGSHSCVVGEHGPEIVITIPTAADQRAMQQAVIDAIKDYQRRGGTPKEPT